MNRQKSLNRIAELLGRFTNEVTILNAASLYDINIHAETVLIPLLNSVMDLELVNANFDQEKNFSAVDLIDTKNRVAVQVTSSSDNEKIKHTLSQFVKYERDKDFDILFIYIISGKQASYTGKGHDDIIAKKFTFNKDQNILDNNDLFAKINGLISLQKIRTVEDLLELEFTDQKIESRRKNLQDPQSALHEEKIFSNALEVKFPEFLYIGELAIDREAIIKKTWEEKFKLKMDTPDRKVLRKAFSYDEQPFSRDWHAFGGKIMSFRNLADAGEVLSNYVDTGTVERINCKEYFEVNEANSRNFVALLRFTFQEKLFHKAIYYIGEENIYRFGSDRKVVMPRAITWKKINRAKRTVLFEMLNKDKTEIVCFKHYAFFTNFHYFNQMWYMTINPTWSFTVDGYKKSGLSKFYMSGLKRLENNKTIYYGLLFIAFCLNNQISEEQEYPYLAFGEAGHEMISTAYEVPQERSELDEADTLIQEI